MTINNSCIKIGLVQMLCKKGALNDNLNSISKYIIEADTKGVDILGFPELSLTGYSNPTRYPEAIISFDSPAVNSILDITREKNITVLTGLIENNRKDKPYITQVVIRNGQIEGFYRKITIVDEKDAAVKETEWWSSGKTTRVFKHHGLKFGIAICADISNEQVFAQYYRQGAQVVFELAAPGLYGEQETRNWEKGYRWWESVCLERLSLYAQKYSFWIAVATQAGRTIDEDFPGGGYVFAPDGRRIFTTKDGSPGAAYLSLDLMKFKVTEIL
jgi:predicted amidohydrolase